MNECLGFASPSRICVERMIKLVQQRFWNGCKNEEIKEILQLHEFLKPCSVNLAAMTFSVHFDVVCFA